MNDKKESQSIAICLTANRAPVPLVLCRWSCAAGPVPLVLWRCSDPPRCLFTFGSYRLSNAPLHPALRGSRVQIILEHS